MRLFHFSDDPHIATFIPRPVKVPSTRPPGREWLNGPLVWAIEDTYDFLYHFPRDCPRILVWATASTDAGDRSRWLGTHRAAAYVEREWMPAVTSAVLHRYEMPVTPFEDLCDAGMWVSRTPVIPLNQASICCPSADLGARGVDLRIVESLAPLRGLWSTSLHVSGIRLRNSSHWRDAFTT